MEWVVTSGESIEEATEAALDELGIDVDEAEIEILEEPRAGLFGIHKREARVRARVAPTTPRPKVERRERRRRPAEGRGAGGRKAGVSNGEADETAAAKGDGDGGTGKTEKSGSEKATSAKAKAAKAKGAKAKSRRSGGSSRSRETEPNEAAEIPATTTEDEGTTDESTSEAKAAPRKRTRKRPAEKAASPAQDTSSDGADTEPTEQGASMTSISIEDQVEVIEDFLDGLMEAFDLDGEISTVSIDDETSEVRVEGDELGYLIGPKGQTLAAVHELCRTVAQRRLAGPHEGRIRLDIGGYRERRREALARFATQVAEDVRSSGVEKALEPMSPPDRKVVHDTINEIDGVTTSSEGEEPRRRVVVSPVD